MALQAGNWYTLALDWIDTIDSKTDDVAHTRVPLFHLVWVGAWISAFAVVIVSLTAFFVVLRMTLHPLDRDTLTRLWINAVDRRAIDFALIRLSHSDGS